LLTRSLSALLFHCSGDHLDLHSFPTRRSSDLTLSPVGRLIPQPGRDRAAVKCWEAIADVVLDAAVAINIEKNRRPEHLRSEQWIDRKSTRLNSSHVKISYAVFCLKKKKTKNTD